jgi:SOS-response transcriptional repressor LexA
MEQTPFHPAKERRTTLDEWILDDPEASFLMTMEGDAMQNHGIHHGDMLIIKRASEARVNDIIISTVDGEWSISTNKSQITTQDQNDGLITIHAVVRALVRKYE